MGASEMTPEQFAGRVRACRNGLVPRAVILAAFFECVGDHPSQIAAYYKLLPVDLAGKLAEMVNQPVEAWIKWATFPGFWVDGHGLGGFALGFSGVHEMLPESVTNIEPHQKPGAHAAAVRWVLLDFLAKEARQTEMAPALNYESLLPKPTPCPYCGDSLRTPASKQCRHCKMDWHDPTNVYRRDGRC